VVKILEVVENDELMVITSQGILIRLPVQEIRVTGRATQGVKIIKLAEEDYVIDVARVAEMK
jgi:DNA gyrase subunit A